MQLIMRLLLLVIVVITLFAFPCLCLREIALINSRDAATHYFLETRAASGDFEDLNPNAKKKLCLDLLVGTTSFSEVADDQSRSFFEVNNLAAIINRTFSENDDDTIFLPNLGFIFNGGRYIDGLPANICAIEESGAQWAITKNAHDDIYLLLRKQPGLKFRLFGILEPKPQISDSDSAQILERKYKAAKRTLSGESIEIEKVNKRDKTTLCLLRRYQKLRLCALCYLALADHEKISYTRDIHVNVEEDKRDAKILIDSASGELSNTVRGDLIPCTFGKGSKDPMFFVTSDPASMHSAYIVKPVWKKRRPIWWKASALKDKIIGYQLYLHLENITPLKSPPRKFDDVEDGSVQHLFANDVSIQIDPTAELNY